MMRACSFCILAALALALSCALPGRSLGRDLGPEVPMRVLRPAAELLSRPEVVDAMAGDAGLRVNWSEQTLIRFNLNKSAMPIPVTELISEPVTRLPGGGWLHLLRIPALKTKYTKREKPVLIVDGFGLARASVLLLVDGEAEPLELLYAQRRPTSRSDSLVRPGAVIEAALARRRQDGASAVLEASAGRRSDLLEPVAWSLGDQNHWKRDSEGVLLIEVADSLPLALRLILAPPRPMERPTQPTELELPANMVLDQRINGPKQLLAHWMVRRGLDQADRDSDNLDLLGRTSLQQAVLWRRAGVVRWREKYRGAGSDEVLSRSRLPRWDAVWMRRIQVAGPSALMMAEASGDADLFAATWSLLDDEGLRDLEAEQLEPLLRLGTPAMAALVRQSLDWAEFRFGAAQSGALAVAARAGNLKLARWLLDEHIGGVDLIDGAGWTPLHHAAHLGRWEMVEFLLDRGADPDASSSNPWVRPCFTVLQAAVASNSARTVKLLLAAGARVERPIERPGRELAFASAWEVPIGNPLVVARLLEAGVQRLRDDTLADTSEAKPEWEKLRKQWVHDREAARSWTGVGALVAAARRDRPGKDHGEQVFDWVNPALPGWSPLMSELATAHLLAELPHREGLRSEDDTQELDWFELLLGTQRGADLVRRASLEWRRRGTGFRPLAREPQLGAAVAHLLKRGELELSADAFAMLVEVLAGVDPKPEHFAAVVGTALERRLEAHRAVGECLQSVEGRGGYGTLDEQTLAGRAAQLSLPLALDHFQALADWLLARPEPALRQLGLKAAWRSETRSEVRLRELLDVQGELLASGFWPQRMEVLERPLGGADFSSLFGLVPGHPRAPREAGCDLLRGLVDLPPACALGERVPPAEFLPRWQLRGGERFARVLTRRAQLETIAADEFRLKWDQRLPLEVLRWSVPILVGPGAELVPEGVGHGWDARDLQLRAEASGTRAIEYLRPRQIEAVDASVIRAEQSRLRLSNDSQFARFWRWHGESFLELLQVGSYPGPEGIGVLQREWRPVDLAAGTIGEPLPLPFEKWWLRAIMRLVVEDDGRLLALLPDLRTTRDALQEAGVSAQELVDGSRFELWEFAAGTPGTDLSEGTWKRIGYLQLPKPFTRATHFQLVGNSLFMTVDGGPSNTGRGGRDAGPLRIGLMEYDLLDRRLRTLIDPTIDPAQWPAELLFYEQPFTTFIGGNTRKGPLRSVDGELEFQLVHNLRRDQTEGNSRMCRRYRVAPGSGTLRVLKTGRLDELAPPSRLEQPERGQVRIHRGWLPGDGDALLSLEKETRRFCFSRLDGEPAAVCVDVFLGDIRQAWKHGDVRYALPGNLVDVFCEGETGNFALELDNGLAPGICFVDDEQLRRAFEVALEDAQRVAPEQVEPALSGD